MSLPTVYVRSIWTNKSKDYNGPTSGIDRFHWWAQKRAPPISRRWSRKLLGWVETRPTQASKKTWHPITYKIGDASASREPIPQQFACDKRVPPWTKETVFTPGAWPCHNLTHWSGHRTFHIQVSIALEKPRPQCSGLPLFTELIAKAPNKPYTWTKKYPRQYMTHYIWYAMYNAEYAIYNISFVI